MKKFTTQLLLLAFIIFPLVLFPQTKPYVHFNEDDGLAGNKVMSILKDREGYMWIGTDNGLSKYDGSKFTNFRKADGLAGNRVWALATDGKRIYVGCYKDGLAIIENNKVTGVYHFNSKFPNSIRRLHYSDFYKMLIVGTDYGIYLFKDSVFYEIRYEKDLEFYSNPNRTDSARKSSILGIVEYKNQIFFTSHTNVMRGGVFKMVINKLNPLLSKVQRIDRLNDNKFSLAVINDTIYAGSYFKIDTYPISTLNEKQIIFNDHKFFLPWAACPISNNEILLGGFGEGIFICDLIVYNTKTGTLRRFPYNINPISINDLFYDSANNLTWVCSDNGLFCLMKTDFNVIDLPKTDGLIDVASREENLYILTKSELIVIKGDKIDQTIP
ncbi:MAG: two-component regulator propeller domain-containing protein, partial [Bacteroidota bacterium]